MSPADGVNHSRRTICSDPKDGGRADTTRAASSAANHRRGRSRSGSATRSSARPAGRPTRSASCGPSYFDGETGRPRRREAGVPDRRVRVRAATHSRSGSAREPAPGRLTALRRLRGGPTTLAWDLRYAGDAPPLLPAAAHGSTGRLPQGQEPRGAARWPASAASSWSTATPIAVTDWIGSQNHNWGSRHTDRYALGQVAGFDDAPDSFLEIATAQAKIGPVRTPLLTFLVLRHGGQDIPASRCARPSERRRLPVFTGLRLRERRVRSRNDHRAAGGLRRARRTATRRAAPSTASTPRSEPARSSSPRRPPARGRRCGPATAPCSRS